jgi:drug/metabolite transporter (DMT)-like permease
VYFEPAVAIALGALFRAEAIAAIAVVGTVLVTAGAYVTSRADRPPARAARDPG